MRELVIFSSASRVRSAVDITSSSEGRSMSFSFLERSVRCEMGTRSGKKGRMCKRGRLPDAETLSLQPLL